MADIKTDPNKKDITKRFSITTEEADKLKNLQAVRGVLILQTQGMEDSIFFTTSLIKRRLDLDESKAPKGYVRVVTMDWNKMEMLQIDKPILEEKTVN